MCGWVLVCMYASFCSVLCKKNFDWQLYNQLDESIEDPCLKELQNGQGFKMCYMEDTQYSCF